MNTARPMVYISGPITLGSKEHNFNQAVEAQAELMRRGFAPFNPMLTMKFPDHEMFTHQEWMEADLPWVSSSDAVLRLPGESVGADIEVAHANDCDVPVFHSIDDVAKYLSRLQRGVIQNYRTTPSLVIGLHGYPEVGKDEIAKYLCEHHNFHRVSFADPLRKSVLAVNPWVHVKYEEEIVCNGVRIAGFVRLADLVRDVGWTVAKKCRDVREYLQRAGTEGGRDIHGHGCWIVIARDDANHAIFNGKNVVFTDVRFDNEIDLVDELGGELWKATRPGKAAVNNHSSEKPIPDDKFASFVNNDAGIDELRVKVAACLGMAEARRNERLLKARA